MNGALFMSYRYYKGFKQQKLQKSLMHLSVEILQLQKSHLKKKIANDK